MSCLSSGFKAEIATIVGCDHIKENEAASTIDYGVLPENLGAGIVVLPGNTEELAAVLRCCHAHGVAVVNGLPFYHSVQPRSSLCSSARGPLDDSHSANDQQLADGRRRDNGRGTSVSRFVAGK